MKAVEATRGNVTSTASALTPARYPKIIIAGWPCSHSVRGLHLCSLVSNSKVHSLVSLQYDAPTSQAALLRFHRLRGREIANS